ncbi:MAG: hypothetical protein SPJ84_06760 [Fusobacterium gastrosuis]|uniref:hypothetical protein n=1 Tax=Fusobacterium gastrosuis TaxID=1755100 RepID=UPI002A9AAF4B|nr:hypothetical protein [Fusobacterium gastrosuis]
MEKKFYKVKDIMEITGLGRTKAYEMVKKFNKELEKNGIEIVKGAIPIGYFNLRTANMSFSSINEFEKIALQNKNRGV